MRITTAQLVFLAILLPTATLAQTPPHETFELSVRYWVPDAVLRLSSDAGSVPGTSIDLKSDLNASNHGIPAVAFVIRPAAHHRLWFEYIPIRYDSTATLGRDLLFSGALYPRGEAVTSTFSWNAYNIGYEYDFVSRPRAAFGVMVEAKQTDVRQTLASASAERSRRTLVPAPALGIAARVSLTPRWMLDTEVRGFAVPDRADGHYGGRYVDVDAAATFSLSRSVGARAGLRWLNIRHLGESDSARMSLPGVYAGIVLRR